MGGVIGAHAVIYSRDAEADRRFLREVLRFPHVDAGGGWLIFTLPPSELAVHPHAEGGSHELYLMVEDIAAFVAAMAAEQVDCSDIVEAGWGRLVRITLPGGGKLGVYEPRHARPAST